VTTQRKGSSTDSAGASPTPAIKPERLVTFVDAVIAIAITVLVLSLVDLVPQAAAHGHPLPAYCGGGFVGRHDYGSDGP